MLTIHSPRVSVAGLLAVTALASSSRAGAAQDRDAAHETQAATRQEPSTLAVSIPWQWLASTGGTKTFKWEADRPAKHDGGRVVARAGRGACARGGAKIGGWAWRGFGLKPGVGFGGPWGGPWRPPASGHGPLRAG